MRESKGHISGNLSNKHSFALTDANHVYLSSTENIVVYGVSYSFGLHLFRKGNDWDTNSYTDFYVSRPDMKEPSAAARKNIKQLAKGLWMDFISKNPQLLNEAERNSVNDKIVRLIGEQDELLKKADEITQQILSLENQEKGLYA